MQDPFRLTSFMKICKTCNQDKPISEYYKHRSVCRACLSIQYHTNKPLGQGLRKPKPIPEYKTCRDCDQTLSISEFSVWKTKKGLRIDTVCKSCGKESRKEYYYKNRETIRAKAAIVRASKHIPKPKPPRKTIEEVRARTAAYKKRRRNEDPLFRLRSNIGTAIANALSAIKHKKSNSTEEIIGCSFAQLKEHLESQFLPGMNWSNRELWHIDHIVPQSLATTEQQVIMLNHYTNLRPLWIIDNLHKAAAITEEVKTHSLYTKLYTL